MADAWTTVVEIEPEWDDATRGLVDGLDLYDQHVHRCGFHQSVLDDPDNNRMRFETDDCAMCAAIAAKHREMAEADAVWLKAHPQATAKDKRPGDGRTLRLRPLTPDEIRKAEQAARTKKEVGRGRSSGKRPRRR